MAKKGRKRIGKLERWSQFGLLERKQTHPSGLTGSATQYTADTAARCAIIGPYLAAHHTMAQAADELILLNFPIGIGHVRRWLKHYIQRQKKWDYGRRHRAVESANISESLKRSITRIRSYLPADPDRPWDDPPYQDLLELWEMGGLGAHGLVPPELHGISVPSDVLNSLLDWTQIEHVLNITTDARLEQALVTARESLGQPGPGGAEYLGALLYARYQIPPAEFARGYLVSGGHICETQHTLAQAMLACTTLAYVDPRTAELGAEEPQSGFSVGIDGAMMDLGRLLSLVK